MCHMKETIPIPSENLSQIFLKSNKKLENLEQENSTLYKYSFTEVPSILFKFSKYVVLNYAGN